MKTIHGYVGGSFLSSFIAVLVVFTFVMSIGVIFGVAEYLMRGVSPMVLLQLVGYGIPTILPYTVPFSLLTASLLVFGRLSADGEITAMKACGISLWQVVAVPLATGFLVTLACVYVTSDAIPNANFARRQMVTQLGADSPADMLPEGQFTRDFPGLAVRVERKQGNQLIDIRIYDNRAKGVRREIRAKRGTIHRDGDSRDVVIDLEDVIINPFDYKRPGSATVERWPVKIAAVGKVSQSEKRRADMTLPEIAQSIVAQESETAAESLNPEDRAKERTALRVEMNKRLALSAACFVFVLLGIPLGIRTHRKESSIGIGISLLVVLVFYMFIVIAETLCRHPEFHPELVVWLPVGLAIGLGLGLMTRAN
jgi:lipopolysaccharide export system permease protein